MVLAIHLLSRPKKKKKLPPILMPNQKPSVMLKQVPFLFPHAQPKLGISTHAFVCKNANHSNFFVCGKKRQAYEKNTGALEHFNCTGTASFPRHSSYKCSTFINAVSFIALSSTYCVPRRPSFFPLPAFQHLISTCDEAVHKFALTEPFTPLQMQARNTRLP